MFVLFRFWLTLDLDNLVDSTMFGFVNFGFGHRIGRIESIQNSSVAIEHWSLAILFVRLNEITLSKMSDKKRAKIDLKQKSDIIADIDKGLKTSVIARKYNKSESTISTIKKNRASVEAALSSGVNFKHGRVREIPFPDLDRKLYAWFRNARAMNIPINKTLLKKKAEELHRESNERGKPFNASNGWIWRFLKRHELRSLKLSGEKLSADNSQISSFARKVLETKHEMGITDEQIYNADETGLFYKMLFDRTYVELTSDSAPGIKIQKTRVTVMACVNATGTHKLRPMVIGKSARPRCFRGWNITGVDYTSSNKAWMTTNLFQNWYETSFKRQVILVFSSVFSVFFTNKLCCV